MTFNEAFKVRSACIYCLTFPNGKKYVGQTRNLSQRMKMYRDNCIVCNSTPIERAVSEFGMDDVIVDILSEVYVENKEDLVLALSVMEIKYIRKIGSLVPNGYNVSIGGEILGLSADSISTLGGHVYSSVRKPVLCYDLNGDLVAEYESIEKCAYFLGVDSDDVSECLKKGKRVFRNEYMLKYKRYGETPKKIMPYKPKEMIKTRTVYEDKVVVRERNIVKALNPVLKYDVSGHFCGKYDTLVDAAASIGLNNAQKGKIHRGYVFLEYDGGEIKQEIGEISRTKRRLPKYSEFLTSGKKDKITYSDVKRGWSSLINNFPIGRFTLDGVFLEKYDSINDASMKTGVPYSNIWACVFGKTKKSQGYIWRQIDESNNQIQITK